MQNPSVISVIKEATAWRGTMDAVTGDQWNVEVREAAKECLEVVYSDVGDNAAGGGGMSGLGGGGYGAPVAGGASSGGGYLSSSSAGYGGPMGGAPGSGTTNNSSAAAPSKYAGIGNPMYKDPRLEPQKGPSLSNMTITEVATSVGGAMLEMIKDPLAKNVPTSGSPQRGAGGYGGPMARPDPVS